MNKRLSQLLVFAILVFISYQTFENPFSTDYFTTMKQAAVPVSKSNQSLYDEIVEQAEKYQEEPQNAIIHKVWKKMPGRNGLKVDIDKSYEKMKEKGKFDEKLLVYDQVKPEVSLKDLPAAPIYRGHPDKEMVTFLINVSWGEDYIPKILNILKKQDVKATFFIEGKWAKAHVEDVKMIKEEGHEIGNHAYNHPDMSNISTAEIRRQIKDTNDILKAITGEKPTLFAPPSGSFTDEVVQIADEMDMETILWTVDTIDWKKPTKDVLINRVMSKIEPGSMVLMHPTLSVSNSLDDLILKIKQKGYKIGNVTTLLSEQR